MASSLKRRNNPIADDKILKKAKRGQLTLYSFYTSYVIRTIIDNEATQQPQAQPQQQQQQQQQQHRLHRYYVYDIPITKCWYFRQAIGNLLRVFKRIYQNNTLNNELLLDANNGRYGIRSLPGYIALEKIYEKIRNSEEILFEGESITERLHSTRVDSIGTPQKDNFNKLVFGFIRSEFEEHFDLVMPRDLSLAIASWYGNIIIQSDILSLNHIQIIGYAFNELIPDLQYFKLHKRFRFLDNRDNCRFVAVIESNLGDILMLFHGKWEERSFSILLRTSIKTVPIYYTWNGVYHLPDDHVLDTNMKFADIFTDWTDCNDMRLRQKAVAGIGSLVTHKLMNVKERAITCARVEAFLFQ